MERKKPADFPRKPLDLLSEYRHGSLDRRSFLEGARRFAVSGLAAGAVFEMMRPNHAWAQAGKDDPPGLRPSPRSAQNPLHVPDLGRRDHLAAGPGGCQCGAEGRRQYR